MNTLRSLRLSNSRVRQREIAPLQEKAKIQILANWKEAKKEQQHGTSASQLELEFTVYISATRHGTVAKENAMFPLSTCGGHFRDYCPDRVHNTSSVFVPTSAYPPRQ